MTLRTFAQPQDTQVPNAITVSASLAPDTLELALEFSL